MTAQPGICNKEEFCRQGAERYKALHDQLVAEHPGEVVAIEPHSGDYFVGLDVIEATVMAQQAFPTAPFYYVRIPLAQVAGFHEVRAEIMFRKQVVGYIGEQGWPRLPVQIKGARAEMHLEAVIDLRFEGFLGVPVEAAVQLGLEFVGWQRIEDKGDAPIFVGLIKVGEQEQRVDISLTETSQAVVGCGISSSCELELDFLHSSLSLRERTMERTTTKVIEQRITDTDQTFPASNCISCGASVLLDSQFCSQCGSTLTAIAI